VYGKKELWDVARKHGTPVTTQWNFDVSNNYIFDKTTKKPQKRKAAAMSNDGANQNDVISNQNGAIPNMEGGLVNNNNNNTKNTTNDNEIDIISVTEITKAEDIKNNKQNGRQKPQKVVKEFKVGDFVAVEPPQGDPLPFWIGRVERLLPQKNFVMIRWFETHPHAQEFYYESSDSVRNSVHLIIMGGFQLQRYTKPAPGEANSNGLEWPTQEIEGMVPEELWKLPDNFALP